MNAEEKILIVVSHPDDEILGCGGSIAKYVKEGNEVAVIFTHEGSTARYDNKNHKEARVKIKSREAMAMKVSKLLKFKIFNLVTIKILIIEILIFLKILKI